MRARDPVDSLRRAVTSRGGVARASSLLREGHSRHHVALAVDRGMLRRIRRDWIAVPEADVALVDAAHDGVVISCITHARRIGLWVAGADERHVAAAPGAAGGKSRAKRVHWAIPLVPRHPDDLVDRIENSLVLIAACQPRERALAIWDSALSKGVVTRAELERLPLSAAARALLADATSLHDSGLETLFAVRLRWLRVRILPQTWIAGHRVDFLIGERLVVQIDGGHHVGEQRTTDIGHDAELALLGYVVLRFGYDQIMNDWPSVQDTIARAVAQGLHVGRS